MNAARLPESSQRAGHSNYPSIFTDIAGAAFTISSLTDGNQGTFKSTMEDFDAKVSNLIEQLRALPESEQADYIQDACGDDHHLAEQVRRGMLAITGESSTSIEDRSTVLDDTGHDGEPLTDSHPNRIASYTIRRIIGSGGMGTVYEATQDSPRRRVAIKVLKSGLVSRSAQKRFQYESQVLGRLRHQGIAQIYEAGTWEAEQGDVPWFAMEYIPNAKYLTDYADEHRLSLRQKLELFIELCQAVHHGHQKGIIHRDLKPGNILVDSSGHPKIIDFGVARSTDSDMAVTTLQTSVGQLIGTVQYMSPEQCDADPDDLDTRSDVYTLGVILYELLTGELPYTLGNKAIHEAARAIKEDAPNHPSTVNRQLRGDIETIVLTALEKERDRRYQSAQGLCEDIERFLRGDPINARPPSIIYQIRVLARKNRAATIAAGSIVVVLVVSIVLVLAFAISQSNQKKLADEARLEADRRTTEAVEAQTELALQVEAARMAKQEATLQAQAASRASSLADQRALEAEEASASLLKANEELEQQAYVASLIQAQDAIQNKYLGEAARVLADAPVGPRNWEWHLLQSQTDQSMATSQEKSSVKEMSDDGRFIISSPRWEPDSPLQIHDRSTNTDSFLAIPSDLNLVLTNFRMTSVLISPDNRHLACQLMQPETDGIVKSAILVWNLESDDPQLTRRIDDHASAMTFSPDGSQLIWIESATPDSELNLFSITDKENTVHIQPLDDPDAEATTFAGPKGKLMSVPIGSGRLSVSPTGKHVAVGSPMYGPVVIDLDTEDHFLIAAPDMTGRGVSSICFSDDGELVYMTGLDGNSLYAMDLESRQPVEQWNLVPHNRIRIMRNIPESPLIATADGSGTIRLLDEQTGSLIGSLHGHFQPVTILSANDEGTTLHSIDAGGVLKQWDLEQQLEPNPATHTAAGAVDHIMIQDDGRLMITASDRYLELWSLDLGQRLSMFPLPSRPQNMAISPDGRHVAITIGFRGSPVAVLDLATGWPIELDLESSTIFDNAAGQFGQPICFSPDSRLVAFGLGRKIFILDIENRGRIIQSTEIDELKLRALETLRFTEDGERVIASGNNSSLFELELGTGTVRSLFDLRSSMKCSSISPDGRFLATGTISGQIRLEETADTGSPDSILAEGHGLSVDDFSFNADGTRLGVVWNDGTLKLFDVQEQDFIMTLMTPTSLAEHSDREDNAVLDFGMTNNVAFDATGSWLAMNHGKQLYTWDSRSSAQRQERRNEAIRRSTMAHAIAEGLLAEMDLESAIDSVRSDDAIDDSLRHAAMMEIMLQTSPWILFENGEHEAAKDRQVALYRQLREKYGLADPRTQHVLSNLIRIYQAMGNHRTASLLARKLDATGE